MKPALKFTCKKCSTKTCSPAADFSVFPIFVTSSSPPCYSRCLTPLIQLVVSRSTKPAVPEIVGEDHDDAGLGVWL